MIDGVLVKKAAAMGFFESRLALILGYFVEAYLEKNPIGACFGEAAPTRLESEQIRMPDFFFIRWDRFEHGRLPAGQVLNCPPDFAVEVLSPSNTAKEMARKRADYFNAGCQLVWEADPEKRCVEVFTSPDHSTILDESGVLTGDPVLPGFRLPVKDWFDRAMARLPKA